MLESPDAEVMIELEYSPNLNANKPTILVNFNIIIN